MPDTRILAFLGTDEALVKEAALRAVQRLTPADASDFANDIVDGQADDSEDAEHIVYEALQALQTVPFFGGPKVVWLKSANFLGDNQTGNAQSTVAAVDRLQQFLEAGLPPDVTFVLSASAIDKRRAFYKRLQKIATVEVFDRADISRDKWEEKLVPLVRQRARMLGIELGQEAATLFIAMVGEDTRRLDSELEKLRVYLGPHTRADTDDVRAVVSKSRGGVVFEIGNAIGRRDLPAALASLQHFLDLGENPVGIIRAGIIPKVRNLLGARDLAESAPMARGLNYPQFQAAMAGLPDDETAHLPRNKSGDLSLYPLYLAMGEARRFTTAELIDALDACLEADRQLVSTGIEAPVVLSQLMVRILARPAPVGSAP